MHFTFDSRKPPMERIESIYILKHSEDHHPSNMSIEDYEPLDLDKKYVVSTRGYLLAGNDGFEMLKSKEIEIMVGQENGVMLSVLARRFFSGLKALKAMTGKYEGAKASGEARKKYRELLRKAMNSAETVSKKLTTSNDKGVPIISPQAIGRIVNIAT